MKKLFVFLLVIALFCPLAAFSQAAEPVNSDSVTTLEQEETVLFPDPLMEKMVRAAMNKPEGEITPAEAEAVTDLQLGIDWQQNPAPNSQIKDISGLENFKNLERLNLSFHAITDISPLTGLNKLTDLSLGGNPITDITPLAGLTNLTFLTLFSCQAQDYTPLANLTGLDTLLLEFSTISDVSMLSGLTELRRLSLANTQVSDVSPLSNLSNLRKLQLAACPISDYSPLSGIYANLEEADFSIVGSLRELGFSPIDNAPQVEGYKTDDMYIMINRAEWGETDNKDEVNMVLLCRNYGTENEITIIYYPNEKQFLVLSHPQDFRYTFDDKSEKMNVEYGDDKAAAFVEKAYDEADPYLLLTPIKDFVRVLTNTFGVSADTLFTLPRETEPGQQTEQPAASKDSLIGLGFKFDDVGVLGVYEEHEPHYMNVAIARPEWGEFSEGWNVEFLDADINGYNLVVWQYADEERYVIQIEKNGKSVKYEYFSATNEYSDGGPDPETIAQMFNDAFGTQGDGFRDKPIAYMEQEILNRFGMSVDKLYAMPKQ